MPRSDANLSGNRSAPLAFFQEDLVATENTATAAPFFVDLNCASLPTKPMMEMRFRYMDFFLLFCPDFSRGIPPSGTGGACLLPTADLSRCNREALLFLGETKEICSGARTRAGRSTWTCLAAYRSKFS